MPEVDPPLKQKGKLKTISVSEHTHSRLNEFGKKGESYDVIINRLLEIAEGKIRKKGT